MGGVACGVDDVGHLAAVHLLLVLERQLLHLCAYTDEDRQAWIQALLQLQVGEAGLAGSAAGGGSVDASQSI